MLRLFEKAVLSLFVLLILIGKSDLLWAAEGYGFSNATEPALPETLVVLPNRQVVNPWLTLPEGWILRNDGAILTEDGLVLEVDGTISTPLGALPEGYQKEPDGTLVTREGFRLRPKKALQAKEKQNPQGKSTQKAEILPKGTKIDSQGNVVLPDGTRISSEGTVSSKPLHEVAAPKEESVALWTMLPLVEVPKNPENRLKEPQTTPPKEETLKKEPKAVPKEEKRAQQKKEPPKPAPKKEEKRPARMGEDLRIPEEAIKTGNLDFLEGCWQGTRPEYYTKRTIYECFCFGQHGGHGKRKVIDPQGHRRCVGATAARLSSNGVLRVSSQGAVCSDGERWGQAEMTCRGKGQKTPCSWVFQDANGGRQAYEIPFVRVQSCGAR